MSNYSSEGINSFCITEALAVVQKKSQQWTYLCAEATEQVKCERGKQAGNRLVHTIGTFFINGYYGCWRAWTGQLTLCVGSKNKKKKANR